MLKFFNEYAKEGDKILAVGSKQIDNDAYTYRDGIDDKDFEYTGMDIEQGDNVDIVVKHPYNWIEIESESFDIVISGQTLEHAEFFWLTFKEMARVLKPGGYMCIIAPKLQKQHRFPVDCWRFYPDGMRSLAKWAGITCLSAETEHIHYDVMPARPIDCVGVFQK